MNTEYAVRLKNYLPTQGDLERLAEKESVARFLISSDRISTWVNFLYDLRSDQGASALIASVRSKIIEIRILVPLGLLHSSYCALRTIVDISTAYTFYYSHAIEWRSSVKASRPGRVGARS